MSNEELAILVQAGHDEYLLPLWQNVQKFTRSRAIRWVSVPNGVNLESAFLALIAAVRLYEAGHGFLTIYGLCLKTEFRRACGVLTTKMASDPLRHAISIHAEWEDSNGEMCTLEDFIEDPDSEQPFDTIDASEEIKSYVSQLGKRNQELIKYRFWDGLTFSEIGKKYGITCQGAQAATEKAISKLRRIMEGAASNA